jgi:hypothetical protein
MLIDKLTNKQITGMVISILKEYYEKEFQKVKRKNRTMLTKKD